MKKAIVGFLLCAVVVLSAILSLTVAAIWLRSYWKEDIAFVYTRHHLSVYESRSPQYHLQIACGGARFTYRDIIEESRTLSGAVSEIVATRPGWVPEDPPVQWRWRAEAGPSYPWIRGGKGRRVFGFQWCDVPEVGAGIRGKMYMLVTPLWAWLLLTLLPLPVARWLLMRQRKELRGREGLCPQCGYDLRAHKPGDKCPECGMLVAGKGFYFL